MLIASGLPIKIYIKEETKVDTDKEQVLFEDFHSEDFHESH